MEFSSRPPPIARAPWRRPGLVLALIALGLYAALLAHFMGASAGGSDSSGYLNHARLLGEGRVHVPPRILPGLPPGQVAEYLYIPLGFRRAPEGTDLVPTYPVGLPLLILAAVPLAGWNHAGDLVMLLHAVAGVLLVFALGQALGLSRHWSAIGAAALAVSPVYLFMSVQAMSDVPALVWTTAAVLAAWRASARPTPPRQGFDFWALTAGAALGMAVLIRPSNALAFVPVGLALGPSPRRWLALVAGGLPMAIFSCAYSHAAYGHMFTTGYDDAWATFSRGVIGPTWRYYAFWLPILLTPVVVLVPGLPVLGRKRAAVLGAWILVFLSFYSAYRYTHETWWYLRFVLPAAPALIVGGLLVGRTLAARWTARAPRLAWSAALLFVLANGFSGTRRLDALSIGRGESTYGLTAAWLKQHLPGNAVFAVMQMSGALFYYSDNVFIRYDWISPGDFGRIVAAAQSAGRPIYAVLFPFEVDEVHALQKYMPGSWSCVGTVHSVTIWRLNARGR